MTDDERLRVLRAPLELPCGAMLKNRLAKSPMSDSLADGRGDPTEAQIRLYERWAEGGVALSFIGEVQGDPRLADAWLREGGGDPEFPRFASVVPGGITAWYTMRLTALAEDREGGFDLDLPDAVRLYEERDARRCLRWRERFPAGS